MANHHQRKSAKAGINNPFRLDTPQGRFINWLAGMMAEKLASQDFSQTKTPSQRVRTSNKKVLKNNK